MGASVNVPLVFYQRDLFYKESDATNNTDNNFSYFQYSETFKSTGYGVNAKLGLIYKPAAFIRLGFAVHTPSYIFFKDEIRSSITTNTESYAGTITESSDNLNSGNAGERNYNLLTPWRAIASASYVFKEIADTKQQRGFISADFEFVNYRSARFYAANNSDQSSNDYYTALNSIVKDYYKPNFNIRLGGELKFDPWMFRLGAAYYGSPYSDAQLKANRVILSGGLGYRAHGFFIDLTYSYSANKDVSFPYRLNDKPNTFAYTKDNRGNIMFTVGSKF
jgi:hypothetical protein